MVTLKRLSTGSFWKAFFYLIRWKNLAIVALTMLLLRYALLMPLLEHNGMHLQLGHLTFLLLVLSTIFITAAGYVINDYFDTRTDRINRPGTVVVGNQISRRETMALHTLFNVLGVLLGFLVAYKIGIYLLSLVFILIPGILWFYSTTYKRQFLIGNLVVAFLTAMVPFMVLLFEWPLLKGVYGDVMELVKLDFSFISFWFYGYFIFAFLLTLVREIIKDTEDFEGDKEFGCQTLPVVWGIRASKIIISVLLILVLLLIVSVCWLFLQDKLTWTYMAVLIVVPLSYTLTLVYKANSRADFSFISMVCKSVMVAGVLYTLVANYIITK